jgi:CDP-glycerol glycerophosphotransferase (TagB/SpsB family)
MLENARLLILDDVNLLPPEFLWLTRKATVLQLWHGVPYKDIGKKSLLRHTVFDAYKKFSQFLQSSSKILVPTQSDLKVYQEIFNKAELFVLPEPKLVTLDQKFLAFKDRFAGVDTAKLNLVNNKIDSGEKVVIWAPTFRELEGTWTEDVISMVAEVAIKYNITILVKPHPHDLFLKQFHFGQESSVIQIDEWEDVYEYIKLSNGLISDFSSLLLELKRIAYPVSRWVPDLEEYLDRHGHLDTADEMNSIHVNQTFDDAIHQILSKKTGFIVPSGANISKKWINKIEEILNED